MAELPPKPLRPASGGDGEPIPAPNSQNPNFPSSQIAPSPYSDLPQISSPQLPPSQPQIIPSAALDYASKQQQQHHHQQQSVPTPQQQRLMSPSSGLPVQPNLQQSGSLMRMSQIHQQLGAAVAANTMRQHSGMYGGQMSFGGPQIPQQQQGNLQMGGGQHLNMQSQIFVQPRQKMGLVQGTQIHTANSSEQALKGMTHGMMGSIGLNSQPRANGAHSYGQQRFTPGQMRQQLLSQQTPLTSQKLIGQSLPRTLSHAAMNPQLSGLTQNGQSALTQSTLSQQPWLKQIQPAMSSPVSPSYHPQQQRQQQAFLPQQLSSSQLHEKFMGLNQQQISQLVQQQPLLGLQQHQPQQHHMFPQHQQQLPQQLSLQQQQQQQLQELSPRVPGPTVQKTISLTGSQSDTPAVGVTASGSSRKGTEASNQLLGKRKIQDLVAQVDSRGKLDPEVEDLLLEIADNFIASVTTFACSLAKHRKSSTLESKDVLLHLEKNWHLTIPGYSREENKCQRNTIRALECQQSERETNGAKCNTRQVLNDSVIIPSLRPERLVLPAAASQMMPNVTRF